MDISFVVILGLPVLYITGNMRKEVAATETGGEAFLLYFAAAAVLSLLPSVRIFYGLRVDISGAFFSIAPAVYLAVKKKYTYRHYLSFVLAALAGVAVSFFSNVYTMPYLPYAASLLAAVAAAGFLKPTGPVFAPVMTGAFGFAGCIMRMISGPGGAITLFGDIGTASLSAAICLTVSYLLGISRRRRTVYHDMRLKES